MREAHILMDQLITAPDTCPASLQLCLTLQLVNQFILFCVLFSTDTLIFHPKEHLSESYQLLLLQVLCLELSNLLLQLHNSKDLLHVCGHQYMAQYFHFTFRDLITFEFHSFFFSSHILFSRKQNLSWIWVQNICEETPLDSAYMDGE